jgi:hypothetical protein
MGILGLFVLIFLFSKGFWFWPLLLLFGWFMWSRGGWHHHLGHWGEHDKRKHDAYEKRKHDDAYDDYDEKRKNDGDDIYYV